MKIVKRLIAHGCSFTYGEELEDPSKTSWPALVAKELNIDCNNLAKPGYSNDAIVQDLVKFDPDQDDLVTVGWSSYLRMGLHDDHGWYTTVVSQRKNIDIIDWNRRERIIDDLLISNADEWLYERWLTQVILLQSFLDAKAIKYLFFSAFDNQSRYEIYKKKFYNLHNRINQHRFIGWPNEGFVEWSYGMPKGSRGHPLEAGHVMTAKKVLESCQKVHDLPRKVFGT